jgi:hypothetical protein
MILREGSHDLCELESGRLTPYFVKAFVSAEYLANIHTISTQFPYNGHAASGAMSG